MAGPITMTLTLGLAAGEVRLREAHEAWARAFELERATILEAIGQHVLDVQHVGSTAIPGVPAKPILDILVGVADFEEAKVCVAPLERAGYLFRNEHGIPRRHYFVKGEPRTHHLHMIERDSEHWRSTVGFRDLLKQNPESARAYADAKKTLAAIYARDRAAYQRDKDEVVERLLRAAATPRDAQS
jgi:GrpB-like predicted nucleotidyltransferase (UPF0157 family)